MIFAAYCRLVHAVCLLAGGATVLAIVANCGWVAWCAAVDLIWGLGSTADSS